MKPSEFVMKELKGKEIPHSYSELVGRNRYDYKHAFWKQDIEQVFYKLNNTMKNPKKDSLGLDKSKQYISVEEHEKEIKDLKTRQINFHCDYSALKVEIKNLKQQLSKTSEKSKMPENQKISSTRKVSKVSLCKTIEIEEVNEQINLMTKGWGYYSHNEDVKNAFKELKQKLTKKRK